jgi:DNA-directed RNA polymerase subunit RPC12/RpoP
MFYNYCPHCGASIGQNQTAAQTLNCQHCGKEIGIVTPTGKTAPVDPIEERIRQGSAARCAQCGQAVEVKGASKTLVPHYAAGQKKMCPGSGKPSATVGSPAATVPAPPPTAAVSRTTPGGRDLSKYYTKDIIRVVWCVKGSSARIEELTLEYLDKADRVRIQIEALRDILGPSFRMKDYPPSLGRPHLAMWGHATACVIARKHERGGYEPMPDAEIAQVVGDVQEHEALFLATVAK